MVHQCGHRLVHWRHSWAQEGVPQPLAMAREGTSSSGPGPNSSGSVANHTLHLKASRLQFCCPEPRLSGTRPRPMAMNDLVLHEIGRPSMSLQLGMGIMCRCHLVLGLPEAILPTELLPLVE